MELSSASLPRTESSLTGHTIWKVAAFNSTPGINHLLAPSLCHDRATGATSEKARKYWASTLLWPSQAHLLHSRKQRGWFYSKKFRRTVSPFDLPIVHFEDPTEILALPSQHLRFGEKFRTGLVPRFFRL